MSKLTSKQERFCQEYLLDLNATRAAIRAGYTAKSACQNASRQLALPEVKSRVAELMQLRAESTKITGEMVLNQFWSMANDDLKNYLSFKPNIVMVTDPLTGKEVEKDMGIEITIKNSDTIDTHNIAEIYKGKDGQFRLKRYDRIRALIQVGRHLGMINDKINRTVNDEHMNSMRPVIIMPPNNYHYDIPDLPQNTLNPTGPAA